MNMAASHLGPFNKIFAQNEVNSVFMCLSTLSFIILVFFFSYRSCFIVLKFIVVHGDP